jgi:hypothetical protein
MKGLKRGRDERDGDVKMAEEDGSASGAESVDDATTPKKAKV